MSRTKKILIALPLLVICIVGAFYFYVAYAFPDTRCEGAHLDVPEEYADCLSCHVAVTPKVTQDWYESKHGIMLVKCAVCHGDPSGEGAIPFAMNPDPIDVCGRCHAPSIERMQEKYGLALDCNSCHPYHQNPIHNNAYETKTPTTKNIF